MHLVNLMFKNAGPPRRKINLIQPSRSSERRPRIPFELMEMESINDHDQAIGHSTSKQERGEHDLVEFLFKVGDGEDEVERE